MHVWLYVVAVLYMVSDAGRPRGPFFACYCCYTRRVMTDGDTSLWWLLLGIVAAVGVCCCLLAQPTPQWLHLVQHLSLIHI